VKEEELLLGPLIVLSDLSLQPTVSVPWRKVSAQSEDSLVRENLADKGFIGIWFTRWEQAWSGFLEYHQIGRGMREEKSKLSGLEITYFDVEITDSKAPRLATSGSCYITAICSSNLCEVHGNKLETRKRR
jgi:hypothetical protein